MKKNRHPFSIEVWDQNYRYGDETCKEHTDARIAEAVAEVEQAENRGFWRRMFYNEMASDRLIPGGRILANVGVTDRPNSTPYNCFVHHPQDINLTDIDSLDGIMSMLTSQVKTLASEGGYGTNFSWMRPNGSYVKGSGIRTPGAVAFMEMWDKTSEIITRGTDKVLSSIEEHEKKKARKGAMMGMLSCFSKDTEVLTSEGWLNIVDVVYRTQRGEKLFAADDDGKFHLIFNAFTKEPEELYEIETEDGTIVQVTADHKFEVVDLIKFNQNNMNILDLYKNSDYYVELMSLDEIINTNNNFSWVMLKIIKDEKVEFDKLKSVTPIGVNYSYDFAVEDSHRIIAKKTGSQSSFYTSNCWHPDIEEFIEAKTKKDKLTKFNISVGITEGFMEAVINDGYWELMYPDVKFEKYKDEWDGDIQTWQMKGYPVNVHKVVRARDLWDKIMLSTYTRNEPGVIFLDKANEYNPIQYAETIHATNPCVVGDTLVFTNIGWIQINHLDEWKQKIPTLKIITRDSGGAMHASELEWVGVTEKNAQLYKTEFTNGEYILTNGKHKLYDDNFKELMIEELADSYFFKHNIIGGGGIVNITNITKLDRTEDVYDLTASPNYNFFSILNRGEIIDTSEVIVNGNMKFHKYDIVKIAFDLPKFAYELDEGDETIQYHQTDEIENINNLFNKSVLNVDCAEIAMGTGVCNLASINLTQFVEFNEYMKPIFKFPEFETTVRIGVRFLDNINDVGVDKTPLDEYSKSIIDKRRIGLGVMGLGSTLMMLDIPYGSPESNKFITKLFNIKLINEIETSADIGVEKGSFKLFDADEYFNTTWWNHLLAALPQEYHGRLFDVMSLRQMRNSSFSDNAPTGNTSILAGIVSGGIEPVFMKEYIRWRSIIPDELRELKANGIQIPDYVDSASSCNGWELHTAGDEFVFKTTVGDVNYQFDNNRGITRSMRVVDYGYKWLEENNMLNKVNPDSLRTSMELSVDEHIAPLAIIAERITMNSSKTINLPEDYSFEDFKHVYINAWRSNIKGVTTYRANTMTAVLEKADNEKYQSELDELFVKSNGHVIKEDVKLPKEYNSKGYIIRDKNKKKWYFNVAFADSKFEKPFALFINTNSRESNEVADELIIRMEQLCKLAGIPDELIDSQTEKYKGQTNVVKIARAIGMALRHNVGILNIIDVLEDFDEGLSSLIYHIKKLLSKFVKDGTKVLNTTCPSCNADSLVYQEGCKLCSSCGWSAC